MFGIYKKNDLQEDINSKKVLGLLKVIAELNTELNLDIILQHIADKTIEVLDYNAAAVFLIYPGNILRSLTVSSTPVINNAVRLLPQSFDTLSISLEEKENLIVKSINERRIIIGDREADFIKPVISQHVADAMQKMLRIKQLAVFPLMDRGKPIGAIMLSTTKEGELQRDLPIIESLSATLAIAINNASLFTNNEKQLVELGKRNYQLEAINKFTNKIITTLDINEVAQNALDSIPEVLNYLGAIYNKYYPEEQKLRTVALSNSRFFNKAIKLLNKKPTDYEIYISDPQATDQINVLAFRDNSIKTDNHIKSVIKDLVPEIVVTAIQKILSISAIVAVPVKSQNRIVGIIDFLISHKRPDEITEQEFHTMEVIASQIGIALDNAYLFNESQKAFDDLKSSNALLMEKYRQEKDMIGILGHELRTPLGIAKSGLELLIKKVERSIEPNKAYILKKTEIILDSLLRESNIVETALSSSQIENNKLSIRNSPVDVIDCIRYAIRIQSKLAHTKGIELAFEPPKKDIPIILADRDRLQEVISNLVSNAVKYTEKGYIKIRANSDNKNLYISVEDTGLGIAKEEINKLGRKFYRIHQYLDNRKGIVRSGGTGLGLYVVKGILAAMNGKLQVDSVIGKGSTFTAIIPINHNESSKTNYSFLKKNEETDLFIKLGLKKG